MEQDRLNDLAFLSVKSEKFEIIDFDDDTTSSKARDMYPLRDNKYFFVNM